VNLSKIYAIDSVNLAIIKTNPPKLLIVVSGRTSSTGWAGGVLVPYIYIAPPADGVQDFDVIAEAPKPGSITLPVLTPIRIELVVDPVDLENYWLTGSPLRGVRCHAVGNSKTATFEAREGMTQVLTLEASDLDTYSPVPAEGPSFSAVVKPLFRPMDVNVMRAIAGFDLHNHDDVKANAESIFGRLSDGSMPCDGSWPQADIGLFKKWMDTGMAA
jgi:hypothetical protein